MKTLYFDITSGISGDMSLALLLSLGTDSKELSQTLSSLTGKKIELSLEKTWRNGISCSKLNIETDDQGQPFRHFTDIKNMIDDSSLLTQNVKDKSIEGFRKIAEAESRVHNIGFEEVHFHEIGAIDTIIDIVGTAWCLEKLNIDKVVSSYPVCGKGTIETEHGILPLPAPATLTILQGAPIKIIETEGELITPTGAAILQTFVDEYIKGFSGVIIKDAYSTGNNEYIGVPNMLRGVIFEDNTVLTDEILSITANIDDMTGENFGQLFDILIKCDDVLDVSYTPAFGKKQRPLYILNVLAKKNSIENVSKLIFKHSSTAGIRVTPENRIIMDREFIQVNIEGQNISVKRLSYNNIEKFYPEWDDCVAAAEKTKLTAAEIYAKAKAAK